MKTKFDNYQVRGDHNDGILMDSRRDKTYYVYRLVLTRGKKLLRNF